MDRIEEIRERLASNYPDRWEGNRQIVGSHRDAMFADIRDLLAEIDRLQGALRESRDGANHAVAMAVTAYAELRETDDR